MTTQNPALGNVNNPTPNGVWTVRSYSYTAAMTGNLTLKFLFETNDRFAWYIDDVSVKNSVPLEMLTNEDFEDSVPLNAWTSGYSASACSATSGLATSGCQGVGRCYYSFCDSQQTWVYQSFATIVGEEYNVTFWFYFDHVTGGNGSGTRKITVTLSY